MLNFNFSVNHFNIPIHAGILAMIKNAASVPGLNSHSEHAAAVNRAALG